MSRPRHYWTLKVVIVLMHSALEEGFRCLAKLQSLTLSLVSTFSLNVARSMAFSFGERCWPISWCYGYIRTLLRLNTELKTYHSVCLLPFPPRQNQNKGSFRVFFFGGLHPVLLYRRLVFVSWPEYTSLTTNTLIDTETQLPSVPFGCSVSDCCEICVKPLCICNFHSDEQLNHSHIASTTL